MGVIRAIRSLKADLGLAPTAPVAPMIGAVGTARAVVETFTPYISALARASHLTLLDASGSVRGAVGSLVDGVEVSLMVADRDRALRRLSGELTAIRADLAKAQKRLADASFVERAPAEVVVEERRRHSELQERQRTLEAYLSALG
jgi:valyl-tRNA synthetase